MSSELALLPAAEPVPARPPGLSDGDRAAIAGAAQVLEGSTLLGRLSSLAGRPLEIVGRALPASAAALVGRASTLAMKAALKVALTTLGKEGGRRIPGLDTAAAATSGALGGAFGLVTLPFELPVSTVLMLRAIAEIARQEGEDLSDPAAALACLEVSALGSRTEADDFSAGGYFAMRSAMAKSVAEAARLAATRGFADKGAPAFMRVLAQIGARFGVVVSQKVAAGAVPIVGAIGGAAINAAFLEHFRSVARAHFTVRRLEREHGPDPVRELYGEIRKSMA